MTMKTKNNSNKSSQEVKNSSMTQAKIFYLLNRKAGSIYPMGRRYLEMKT